MNGCVQFLPHTLISKVDPGGPYVHQLLTTYMATP